MLFIYASGESKVKTVIRLESKIHVHDGIIHIKWPGKCTEMEYM
jgi:hypothetical protein